MSEGSTYAGSVSMLVKEGGEIPPKIKRKAKKVMKKDILKLVKKMCDRDDFWIVTRFPSGGDILSYKGKEIITMEWKINFPQIEDKEC